MTRPLTGKLVKHKSGIYIRQGTFDEYIPNQQNEYKALDFQDRYVLDLGGHIGAFAHYALERGAMKVISVEPYEPNYKIWEKNLSKYGDAAQLIKAAAVSSLYKYETVPLYLCGGDTSGHSTLAIRGRDAVDVNAVKLEELLHEHPEVVKIDVEGSEYDLIHDFALFLDYEVEEFAAELHLHLRDWRERAVEFVNIVEQWYYPVVPAKIGAKNWNTTGVWRLKRG